MRRINRTHIIQFSNKIVVMLEGRKAEARNWNWFYDEGIKVLVESSRDARREVCGLSEYATVLLVNQLVLNFSTNVHEWIREIYNGTEATEAFLVHIQTRHIYVCVCNKRT